MAQAVLFGDWILNILRNPVQNVEGVQCCPHPPCRADPIFDQHLVSEWVSEYEISMDYCFRPDQLYGTADVRHVWADGSAMRLVCGRYEYWTRKVPFHSTTLFWILWDSLADVCWIKTVVGMGAWLTDWLTDCLTESTDWMTELCACA